MKTTMLIAVIAASLAGLPALAQPQPPVAKILTVDSTMRELVLDPRTRPVIERHMPGLPARLETDRDLEGMFADVSLAGMAKDPHARGFTPAVLERLAAELAEAQKTPPPVGG